MIIHKPKIETKGNKVRVSAYIEVETKKEFSGTLWFEFDKEYEKYLSKSSNGFLANMLLFAMYLNEDITLKGKISPKLEYGLDQVQNYFSFWEKDDFSYYNPHKFHKVKIKADGRIIEKSKLVGGLSTFSGGVDSFYTLLNHLPKNQPNTSHQVKYCLYLNGFSRTLSDEATKNHAIHIKRYKELEKSHNLKMISVSSNYEDFYIGKGEVYSPANYGVSLSSVALFLTPLVSRFYISSSYEYSTFRPEGSNPITDPMLSTETLDVIHYDCSFSRIEKTKEIAKWPETYNKLMVCIHNPENNCCECEKCIRVMITLQLAGKLSKYTTFPQELTREKVRTWFEKNETHLEEVIAYAKELNDRKMLSDLKHAVFRRKMIYDGKWGLLQFYNKAWAAIWAPSAYLKKRSKTYRKLIKIIKNG